MHFSNDQPSILASDFDIDENTPRNKTLRSPRNRRSDEDDTTSYASRLRVQASCSAIACRHADSADQSLRAFRERADALSFKLAVMTVLARQAHREARILEQQFLVQKSLATLNRQNALTRENNRKTSERLHGLIRKAEAAVRRHCRARSEPRALCVTT